MTTWRGRVGLEMGAAVRMEGTPVYLWPTHVDVWQKPSQYCKVIILQLKQLLKKIQSSSLHTASLQQRYQQLAGWEQKHLKPGEQREHPLAWSVRSMNCLG